MDGKTRLAIARSAVAKQARFTGRGDERLEEAGGRSIARTTDATELPVGDVDGSVQHVACKRPIQPGSREAPIPLYGGLGYAE